MFVFEVFVMNYFIYIKDNYSTFVVLEYKWLKFEKYNHA